MTDERLLRLRCFLYEILLDPDVPIQIKEAASNWVKITNEVAGRKTEEKNELH